eukprot:TRINITY_DN4955_c0_g2_i1.p1 TRINITY_DN4955_c0_g2~~TRINITY_DN4955_c0_g2_i1.p1  ORF type:complete len:515 (+),score=48.22 TRINITY_DN4955_c0_g2_i1:62-1606(+)
MLKKVSGYFNTRLDFTTIVIVVIAFTQGILGLADLAVSYLFKDHLKIGPSEATAISSFVAMPWMIKPLWGFISDGFPILGYRRKSYLIFFSIMNFCCYLYLAKGTYSVTTCIVLLLIIQVGVSFCNVIGEALLVEKSQTQHSNHTSDDASQNVSLFFGARNVGYFVTAYLSGVLIAKLELKSIFLITAFFPIILFCFAIFLKERQIDRIYQTHSNAEGHQLESVPNVHEDEGTPLKKPTDSVPNRRPSTSQSIQNLRILYDFVSQPEIYKPIFIIFLFMVTPSSGSVLFYFYTNVLKFSPEFMGVLRIISAASAIIAVWVYNRYLAKFSFKKVFAWTTVLGVLVSMTQLILVTRLNQEWGIPDKFFCFGDSLVVQMLGEINGMPILVLACQMCPKNIEGTMYALLMSSFNFASMISAQSGALLTYFLGVNESNFDNLWLLLLLTNLMYLLPLALLSYLKVDKAIERAKKMGSSGQATEEPPVPSIHEEAIPFQAGSHHLPSAAHCPSPTKPKEI